MGLFLRTSTATAAQVGDFFDMNPRRASALCVRWVAEGFVVVENPSTKARSYRLADAWEALVSQTSP